MTPEDRELSRRNNVLGWSLLALFVVLALGTVAIGYIFNAVSSY